MYRHNDRTCLNVAARPTGSSPAPSAVVDVDVDVCADPSSSTPAPRPLASPPAAVASMAAVGVDTADAADERRMTFMGDSATSPASASPTPTPPTPPPVATTRGRAAADAAACSAVGGGRSTRKWAASHAAGNVSAMSRVARRLSPPSVCSRMMKVYPKMPEKPVPELHAVSRARWPG